MKKGPLHILVLFRTHLEHLKPQTLCHLIHLLLSHLSLVDEIYLRLDNNHGDLAYLLLDLLVPLALQIVE